MKIILDRRDRIPIYMQIRNQITIMISEGTLAAGSRLPAERTLAMELGVNRSTIVRAYEELAADGMVEARVGRGTQVSQRLALTGKDSSKNDESLFVWQHILSRHSNRMQDGTLAAILNMISNENLISFASGVPDPALFPLKESQKFAAEIMENDWKCSLDYSDTMGLPALREALSSYLNRDGYRVNPERILICSGSQQCLDILARVFIETGDNVIVEEPTYIGALNAFRLARARFLTVPVDREGMRTDLLEPLLARNQVKFIYTMPNAHNPAACTMSLERRRHLMELARQYRIPIIEDDAYGCLRFTPEALPSLASLDQSGQVIYLGSASKMIFPGLRIGWMAGPDPVINASALIKQVTDLHSASFNQLLMSRLLQKNELETHLDRIRPLYREKRDFMMKALDHYAVPGLKWELPEGGLYIWAELPANLNAAQLLVRTERRGVVFMPGAPFFPEGEGKHFMRLSYSRHGQDDVMKGIKIICEEIQNMLTESIVSNNGFSAISNLHLV